jgi:hypothetical protein
METSEGLVAERIRSIDHLADVGRMSEGDLEAAVVLFQVQPHFRLAWPDERHP